MIKTFLSWIILTTPYGMDSYSLFTLSRSCRTSRSASRSGSEGLSTYVPSRSTDLVISSLCGSSLLGCTELDLLLALRLVCLARYKAKWAASLGSLHKDLRVVSRVIEKFAPSDRSPAICASLRTLLSTALGGICLIRLSV